MSVFLLVLFAPISLAPSLYLFILTLGAVLQRLFGESSTPSPEPGHLAFVIPAHNEESGILDTIKSVQETADSNTSIHVVADNCTDHTAECARLAGAIVWEREDSTRRSKGYAIEWALPHVFAWGETRGHSVAFLAIVDADASISKNSVELARCAFARGAQVLQSEDILISGECLRTRLATMGFAAMNVVRGLGRLWWGTSDTLKGNGMWFRRSVLDTHPWRAYSLAEDFEHSIHLIQAGVRIQILPNATITGAAAVSREGAREQRLRWEAGRLGIAATQLPRLAAALISRPSLTAIDLFMEVFTPPLAILVCIYASLIIIPDTRIWIGIPALILLAIHVLTTVLVARLPLRSYLDLAWVPLYIAWKITLLPATWIQRHSRIWIRADRNPRSEQKDQLP